MDIQARKLELVQLIINTREISILEKIENIFSKEKEADWWDEISDAEKESIKQGLAEADRGEFIPHEEVMKEVKEKYNLK